VTEEQSPLTPEKEAEIERLADAICRYLTRSQAIRQTGEERKRKRRKEKENASQLGMPVLPQVRRETDAT
jgi:hypothetical protein